MRLINTENLKLEEFFDKRIPNYAILSHTWGENEVILADYEQRIHSKEKQAADDDAVKKIRDCCRRAAKEGHSYAWIDTCCIDKKSSAELSEAINSMYRWYQNAQICYVYFGDVSKQSSWEATADSIRQAHWFTRGWTLQELLAPRQIKFYDCDWNFLGGRWLHALDYRVYILSRYPPGDQAFATLISETTNIDLRIIKGSRSITDASVAERMSWAADRATTRREDIAYCLLGLFDVNMPLLYGEGDKAFTRLQIAIMEATDDHTIFAWDYGIAATHSGRGNSGCLAESPSEFKYGHLLSCPNRDEHDPTTSITSHYSLTNLGVHITLPVIDLPHMHGTGVLAALSCTDRRQTHKTKLDHGTCVVAIPLYQSYLNRNSVIFHRHHLQSRPLLVESAVFQRSRAQTMYIERSRPRTQHIPRNDFLSCDVAGIKLFITERFPWFTNWIIWEGGDRLRPSVTFIVELDKMDNSFQPPKDSIITVGLKVSTQHASITGHGSFFMLMQYVQLPELFHLVGKDFRLVSGVGYSSLATFMLDEKAIAASFQAPAGDIMLQDLGGCNASERIHCRQIQDEYVGPEKNMFGFCLEVV